MADNETRIRRLELATGISGPGDGPTHADRLARLEELHDTRHRELRDLAGVVLQELEKPEPSGLEGLVRRLDAIDAHNHQLTTRLERIERVWNGSAVERLEGKALEALEVIETRAAESMASLRTELDALAARAAEVERELEAPGIVQAEAMRSILDRLGRAEATLAELAHLRAIAKRLAPSEGTDELSSFVRSIFGLTDL